MIGDKWSDILSAFRAGAKGGILLQGKELAPRPQELDSFNLIEISDWKEAKRFILPLHSSPDF